MNDDDINLENISKMFEYERIVREIDECNDIEVIRDMLKKSIKLFYKQQEVVMSMGINGII